MPKSFQYTPSDDDPPRPTATETDKDDEPIYIVLGTSAQENTDLIKKALPSWWWLHLDSVASGHVIIMTDMIDDNIIEFAAHICIKHVSDRKRAGALYRRKGESEQQFNALVTRISNLVIDQGSLGEVEFKSRSKRKLLKQSVIFDSDLCNHL